MTCKSHGSSSTLLLLVIPWTIDVNTKVISGVHLLLHGMNLQIGIHVWNLQGAIFLIQPRLAISPLWWATNNGLDYQREGIGWWAGDQSSTCGQIRGLWMISRLYGKKLQQETTTFSSSFRWTIGYGWIVIYMDGKAKGVLEGPPSLHSDEQSKANPLTFDPKTKSSRVSTFWCKARTSKIGLLLLMHMDPFARSIFPSYSTFAF